MCSGCRFNKLLNGSRFPGLINPQIFYQKCRQYLHSPCSHEFVFTEKRGHVSQKSHSCCLSVLVFFLFLWHHAQKQLAGGKKGLISNPPLGGSRGRHWSRVSTERQCLLLGWLCAVCIQMLVFMPRHLGAVQTLAWSNMLVGGLNACYARSQCYVKIIFYHFGLINKVWWSNSLGRGDYGRISNPSPRDRVRGDSVRRRWTRRRCHEASVRKRPWWGHMWNRVSQGSTPIAGPRGGEVPKPA